MVRNWLTLAVEDHLVTQEGLGLAVVRCLGLFYADEGVVVLWDPEWLQVALNVLIGIFHPYLLVGNFAKSKFMIFQPVTLRSGVSEETVGRRCNGRG